MTSYSGTDIKIEALRAAVAYLAPGIPQTFVSLGDVTSAGLDNLAASAERVAEHFTRWLCEPLEPERWRPTENAKLRPCGAFPQPDWYVGDEWKVCVRTDEHDGDAVAVSLWHRAADHGMFATHHMTSGTDSTDLRCSCGESYPHPGMTPNRGPSGRLAP